MDDLFGDEEEQISENSAIDVASNEIYIELVRQKSHIVFNFGIDEKFYARKKVLIITSKGYDSLFTSKLQSAKFEVTCIYEVNPRRSSTRQFDAIVFLRDISKNELNGILDEVVSSGIIIIPKFINTVDLNKSINKYLESFPIKLQHSNVYRTQPTQLNPTATVYWHPDSTHERKLIDSICIRINSAEIKYRIFTTTTHEKIIQCMQQNGVCILKGLYTKEAVKPYSQAAIKDMKQVLIKLRQRGIDLLEERDTSKEIQENTSKQIIENYHEISMREARRCDLRNGYAMKQLYDKVKPFPTMKTVDEIQLFSAESNIPPLSLSPSTSILHINGPYVSNTNNDKNDKNDFVSTCPLYDIRHHPGILAVLTTCANPEKGTYASGNWGRWNFEGGGPDSPPTPLTVGQIGTVMSLPGCTDQTIHSDTAHLYTHIQLPGHYYNVFIPALDPSIENNDNLVGQTAFVVGSHLLQVSYNVMVDSDGNQELHRRLIRPHMEVGDVLIFDCRILHLGLANRHPSGFPDLIQTSNNNSSNMNTGSSGSHKRESTENTSQSSRVIHTDTDITTQEQHENKSNSSNTSSTHSDSADTVSVLGWRPMLYINYHQPWFIDPKNWNNNEKLFP